MRYIFICPSSEQSGAGIKPGHGAKTKRGSTMSKPATPKPNHRICEVCEEEMIGDPAVCGCEKCGRLFGPCCNSADDNLCVECA